MTDKLSRSQLAQRLASIKLLSLDVDGVLTDGGLYYSDDGRQLRKFNVKDGLGIQRAMEAGLEVAMVSAGSMPTINQRAETLGVRHVFTGVSDKLETVRGLCRELGIGLNEAAHMGDDLTDLGLMESVGCPITVLDAVAEVIEVSAYVTERPGGGGAVREICDLLVASRG
ncbi:MAG: HAD hydrolase family protein [Rhodospirillales bacterium]